MNRQIEKISFVIENEEGKEDTKEILIKELTVSQVKRILFSATSSVKADKEKRESDAITEENMDDITGNIFDIFGKEFKELLKELKRKGVDLIGIIRRKMIDGSGWFD